MAIDVHRTPSFAGVGDPEPSDAAIAAFARLLLAVAENESQHHPDRGGKTRDMQVVNECHDILGDVLNVGAA